MIIKRLTVLFASLWGTVVLGQNLDTLYLDSLSRPVHARANASSMRIISSYDPNGDQYWVSDFTIHGNKFFEGQIRFLNSALATGKFNYFFSNGTVSIEGNVQHILTKDFTLVENLWYPNGHKRGNIMIHRGVVKLLSHYDSLGTMDVNNGNGFCHCIDFGEKTISEGKVVDGVREGEWLIKDFKGAPKAKELYANGTLVAGMELNSDSVQYVDESISYRSSTKRKMERAIKSHLRNSLKAPVGQRREIFYLLRAQDNHINDVELLLDHFLFENKVDPVVPVRAKLSVEMRGRKNAMTAVSKLKMRL
ncbi:MAG TPA: hypothetical protein VL728_03385 [Cyclobacteriaceae bacterium]|nr:hypothetical protein [Cyclobacteriaceae bacterium]